MRAPCWLMAGSRSAMPNEPSLMRFAPNVLVSTMSAPARTYSWCTSATRSGCVTLSASKLLLMKMPFAYSIVPIAPSQTSTRSSRASRNGISTNSPIHEFSKSPIVLRSGIQPLRFERLRIYQQIGFRDDVEADRSDALAHRIAELVMVAEQVHPRMHGGEHVVQRRFTGIDPTTRGIEGPRRFVGEKEIDLHQRLAHDHLFAHEVAALV